MSRLEEDFRLILIMLFVILLCGGAVYQIGRLIVSSNYVYILGKLNEETIR